MEGILIGWKHTWKDWRLYLQHYHISYPQAKQNRINMPGSNGLVDMTDYPNGTTYENRIITMVFESEDRGYPGMIGRGSEIANLIQGKKIPIIFDDDRGYYYEGRCVVDTIKVNEMVSQITITADVGPYKYENNTGSDWKWDSFSFRTGIIRMYENLIVSGLRELRIIGTEKPIVPVITSSAAMSVSYAGKTYPLKPGRNKVYGIQISLGDHVLVFQGIGIVSVEYKGGRL